MAVKQHKTDETRVKTSIRVPSSLYSQLVREADRMGVSLHFLILEVLNDYAIKCGVERDSNGWVFTDKRGEGK